MLVVDDEQTLANVILNQLKQLGYQGTAVTDAREALSLVAKNPNKFDIVLTDQFMPSLRGDQLAVEINRIRADLPIVICTGYSPMADSLVDRQKGIRGLIMKPISRRDLADVLRAALDKSV